MFTEDKNLHVSTKGPRLHVKMLVMGDEKPHAHCDKYILAERL
jgi:hypothetical protein